MEELGRVARVWDPTEFPHAERLTWTPGSGLRSHADHGIDCKEVTAVWWRRGGPATVSPRISDRNVQRFCAGESRDFVEGAFAAMMPAVVNDPWAERRAGLKLYQLRVAADLGLRIPDTVVSSDSESIRLFLREHPRAVVKTLRNDYPTGVPTRVCTPEDFPPLATSFAPSIVQELVVCQADIRLLVVGERVFAAELRRPDANERVDWRVTASGNWRPRELPDDMTAAVLTLTHRLGLEMASMDFRLTPKGEYVFLEVNANGQFLFLEVDAGLPVSEAVARHLVRVSECNGRGADRRRSQGRGATVGG